MRNIYRLEKYKVLIIESNSLNPILRYKIQVNEKLAETLFKLTDNTFKIDFEFTQLQYLEFIEDIEKNCYDKEFETLVAYWEKEKLKFISPNEKLSELINLRDYYKKAYFSDNNVLQYYCVHDKEELSEKLAKFGKYERLKAHPTDLFKDINSPKEVLEFVIYHRFKQLLQFETLNYLIECEEELPSERFDNFKNGVAQEYCETLINFFKNENPRLLEIEIKSEIEILQEFILNAEKVNYQVAKKKNIKGHLINNENEHIYSRLKNPYYQDFKINDTYNSKECVIYGKYFLYYDWLKAQLEGKKTPNSFDSVPNISPLEHRAIVFLYHVFNSPITEGNKGIIALRHGKSKANSGKRLKSYSDGLKKFPETFNKYDAKYLKHLISELDNNLYKNEIEKLEALLISAQLMS